MFSPASFTRTHAMPVWYPPNQWRMDALSGLGDQQQMGATGIAAVAAQGAATTGMILTALHVSALAGPIGAAVAGLTMVGIAIASHFKGCGQTCVDTTNIVNQAEPILQQNVNHYLSSPVRYRSMQLAALNNFDTVWNAIVKACSNPAYQQAGQRCVTDRQAGACVWHDASGQCWNWFKGYRDPIANDPSVVPDPDPSQATLTQNPDGTFTVVPTATTALPMPLILGGAALVALLMVGNSK